MKEYSVYFWNGCHAYIKASSYQEAMELAEEQAKGMATAVDYILALRVCTVSTCLGAAS